MVWFRIALIALPLLLLAAGYFALGHVSQPRLRGLDGSLVAVYHGAPVALDVLRGGDPISSGIRDLVLEPLVHLRPGGKIEPGLASSWREGQTLAFVYPDDVAATAASLFLNRRLDQLSEELGVSEVSQIDNELRVGLSLPRDDAAGVLLASLQDHPPLPIHQVRVELSVDGASEYHRNFLEGSIEGNQVHEVWFDGDSAYELFVAGDLKKFLKELWIYFGEPGDTAEKIEILDSSSSISEPWVSFTLGFDETWHDGVPVTANDFFFTLETLKRLPESQPLKRFTKEILRVESDDIRQIKVVYRRSFSPGLAGWGAVRILPSHYLREPVPELWPSSVATDIPGSGDVHVVAGEGGKFAVMVADGTEGSFPKGGRAIRFVPAPARTELVASRRMGEIDIMFPRDREVEKILQEPLASLIQAPSGQWELVAFNLQRSLLSDRAVRTALAMAIDRSGIIDSLLAGNGDPIQSLFSSTSGLTVPPFMLQVDAEKSRALLAEAGWAPGENGILERSGRTFVIELVTNGEDTLRSQIAHNIALAWRDLGIQVEIKVLPWNDLIGRTVSGRDFDVALLGWKPDPTWDLKHFWHSESIPPAGSNFLGFADSEVDRLVDRLRVEYSPEERNRLAGALQERLLREMPFVPLFEKRTSMVIFDSGRPVLDGTTWNHFIKPQEGGY